MEQIKTFNDKINCIEKLNNLGDKTEKIKEIRNEIRDEVERVNKIKDRILESKSKRHKRFKGLTVEELSDMFQEETDIEKKILILEQINYLVGNIKNKLFED
tara:strand:- start:344 stop:649 length:306 start_codon:yes stop_codon:yes gene_type:complete